MPSEYAALDLSTLIRLPPNSVRVEDPDEEIFLLYTGLGADVVQDGTVPFSGLGSVNSRADMLSVTLDLPPSQSTTLDEGQSSLHKRKRPKKKKSTQIDKNSLEIELFQATTSLRTKKGDTGSVLWRITREICSNLLHELCSESEVKESFFDINLLSECHILELGSGTGLLSLVLSHWTRRFTATDLDYLVPLMRKNIVHNLTSVGSVLSHYLPHSRTEDELVRGLNVETLNWLDVHNSPSSVRSKLFPPDFSGAGHADIIFAVDCVYNSSLLPPLVTVLNHYAIVDRTRVIVAVELRSEDVLREFLELWMANGNSSSDTSDSSGKWIIDRLHGDIWMNPSFAFWVGWKTSSKIRAEVLVEC